MTNTNTGDDQTTADTSFSFGVDYVQRWGRPSIAAQCANGWYMKLLQSDQNMTKQDTLLYLPPFVIWLSRVLRRWIFRIDAGTWLAGLWDDEEAGGTAADDVFFLAISFASSALLFVLLRDATWFDCCSVFTGDIYVRVSSECMTQCNTTIT